MGALLENHVAMVTGAGRGIGFGIAEKFAQEGAKVVIGELVEERGRQAADRLVAAGYQARSYPLDVTQVDSCAQITKKTLEAYGKIDILVNNAGLFYLHKSEEMPEDHWRIQIDVMLSGAFFMTQAVARDAMIPQGGGVVVNIASIGGMGGWPMRSAYNAAKAGLIVLTEVLATEWAQYHIRLNCVSPSVTRTEMMDSLVRQGEVTVEKYANRTPLGRVAEVDEVVEALLFLASDRASFITGENLRVDGGWVPYGNLYA
ncbi:MAG: SDR family NAD(P)-dependent oxidoreductase, partial [Anaerolineales bacterium]